MIRFFLQKGCHLVTFKTGLSSWAKRTVSGLRTMAINSPTAGIIVIGDEILKGQVRDSNSHFIISRLYNIGVRVMKVSVVGDDVNEICNEVQKFSRQYTYVITSGGIGPTHDDVTFEGVAKAFAEKVFPHPELIKICSEFYNTSDLSSPAMKLAYVPESAKLKYGFDPVQNCKSKYPNVSVKNVFIFPGVPPLLEKSFTMLCEELFGGSGTKFHKYDIFINVDEVSIAERLSMAVEEFPSVAFGSYPQYDNSYYRVKLTAEASDLNLLSRAVDRLKELLPQSCLVEFDSQPLELSYGKIESLGLQAGMNHVSSALHDVVQALSSSRIEDIALCIDSSLSGIVTLHLFYAAQKKLEQKGTVATFCIQNSNSDASEKFLKDAVSRYMLHEQKNSSEIRTALSALQTSHPNLKLLIAGCGCNAATMQQVFDSLGVDKDISSPTFVTPVSSWNEAQLLQFVRKLNLPYLEDKSS